MSKSDIRNARKTMANAKAVLAAANETLIRTARKEALLRDSMAVLNLQRANAEKAIAEYLPVYVISRGSLEHVGAL